MCDHSLRGAYVTDLLLIRFWHHLGSAVIHTHRSGFVFDERFPMKYIKREVTGQQPANDKRPEDYPGSRLLVLASLLLENLKFDRIGTINDKSLQWL